MKKSKIAVNELTFDIVKIDPETAALWLKQNTHNRPLAQKIVAAYAASMLRGEWKINGESIKFSKEGRLIDGQYRLSAIIKSGVTIDSPVVRGIEQEAFNTMDIGKGRRNPDFLALNGEKNINVLAGALLIFFHYENNSIDMSKTGLRSPSPTQALDLLERHPYIRDSVDFVINRKNKMVVGGSNGAGCHYIFSKFDHDAANDFFNRLYEGNNLDVNDPILALRNKLINLRGTHPTKKTVLAYIITAWNAYRRGEEMAVIRIDGREFPEPI